MANKHIMKLLTNKITKCKFKHKRKITIIYFKKKLTKKMPIFFFLLN